MDEGLYRVCIRRGIRRQVRPEAEKLDNRVFFFTVGWVIEPEDSSIYVGEYAMIPHDSNYPLSAPSWIASGDLVHVK